jgi:hypothetical protein
VASPAGDHDDHHVRQLLGREPPHEPPGQCKNNRLTDRSSHALPCLDAWITCPVDIRLLSASFYVRLRFHFHVPRTRRGVGCRAATRVARVHQSDVHVFQIAETVHVACMTGSEALRQGGGGPAARLRGRAAECLGSWGI